MDWQSVNVQFSQWLPWNEFLVKRKEDPVFQAIGVYMLGRFEKAPPGHAAPDQQQIVYIGETTSQSLRTRLRQFEYSAFLSKNGHSGGHTYFKLHGSNSLPIGELYISVHPVNLEGAAGRSYTKFLERAALWAYVQKHKVPPQCNKL